MSRPSEVVAAVSAAGVVTVTRVAVAAAAAAAEGAIATMIEIGIEAGTEVATETPRASRAVKRPLVLAGVRTGRAPAGVDETTAMGTARVATAVGFVKRSVRLQPPLRPVHPLPPRLPLPLPHRLARASEPVW